MESFRNISWNLPIEADIDFATADEIKSSSITYKILHGSFKAELSSDSSDESLSCGLSPSKNATKKKKKKKKNTTTESKEKSTEKSTNDKCSKSLDFNTREVIVNRVRYSSFTAAQHASFVVVLRSVQNHKGTIPPESMAMKEAIEKEQKEFVEHMRELWKTAHQKHYVLMDGAKRFTEDIWKSQLKRVKSYPQFYTSMKKIPLVYPADGPAIEVVPLDVLLEMGIVPKFHVPNEEILPTVGIEYSKLLLLNASNPSDADSLLHIPVSSDRNAEVLAVKERADIVISSSGLKCIADNISSKFDKVWNIPIVVKQYSIKDGSSVKSHKVVYVDKRLAAKNMNTSERNLWCHKIAIKSLMCHHRDPTSFRYQENSHLDLNVEFTHEDDLTETRNNLQDARSDGFCNNCHLPLRRETPQDDDSDSNELIIATEDSLDSNKTCTCEKRTSEIQKDEDRPFRTPLNNTEYTTVPPSCKTNVSYRLWKLSCEERSKEDLNEKFLKGRGSHKELRVLVRCKMDACEHENNKAVPICISCKLEYQAEYGAEKISVSSLVREWTSLFFRPEASLRRIRIDALSEEVILTEKVTLRDVSAMALHHHNFLIRRNVYGSLYQVMTDLATLKPGHYLLSHDIRHGPFACVLAQTNENQEYDLYADYETVNPAVITMEDIPQWTPIDTNIVTQKNIAAGQIPATFKPLK